MNTLTTILLLFISLESLNILILYFFPQSDKGNGIGVFNAYEKSKADPEVHRLINYLINWVAGTKLIFIALLLVILVTGSDTTQRLAMVALVLSVLTFYWRLYPAIREMDRDGQITPKGYSKGLAMMIGGFIGCFVLALLI